MVVAGQLKVTPELWVLLFFGKLNIYYCHRRLKNSKGVLGHRKKKLKIVTYMRKMRSVCELVFS